MSLAERVNRASGTALKSMLTSPSAATASLCRTTPVGASIAAISSIGWIVPISLLAQPTDARMVLSVIRACSFLGETRP